MRVLAVCNREPDPQGRGDAKIAQFVISALRRAGHDVWPLSAGGELRMTDGFLYRVRSALRGEPLQLALTYSASFHQQVRAAAAALDPDLAVAVHARSLQYVPAELRARTFAFIYDTYGRNYATYVGAVGLLSSVAYRVEAHRMTRFEAGLSEAFGRIGIVSEDDALHLRRRSVFPTAIVHVPYPVDLDFFSPQSPRPPSTSPRYVFTGRLNYLPNRDAARQLITNIWPRISTSDDAATLTIVGADPPATLLRLARGRGVRVESNVPDIRTHLSGADALLVPMRLGGGIQTKILEAMASGVPVICSPHANAGIRATPEVHVLLANSAASFQSQARRLRDDTELRESIASNARRFVELNYSHDAFRRRFLQECDALARWPHSDDIE